ncbi:SWIM zinc finger family protein [Georgenia faecalis]|uniref:SWIM zinc finger family protein n=1 Tax=Georgenia faecalis TaxID=2483799 RepID=A0ABV9DAJ2_9MICO|nr:SWIM zinc finger family protein [Georgenia faecalis]
MRRPPAARRVLEVATASALDEDVLKEARRLARRGAVGALALEGGAFAVVTTPDGAQHAGWSAPTPTAWEAVEAGLLADAAAVRALLGPGPLEHAGGALEDVLADLVPEPSGWEPRCTCEEWLLPCPHALAVVLALADAVTRDGWTLLQLHGKDRDWVVAAEAARRARTLLAEVDGAQPSTISGVTSTCVRRELAM